MPSAVMTGGRMKGASPSSWKTCAQGAMRRHRNQASGSAMATARAAAVSASRIEAISALRQPGSTKICAYQASEKPTGRKGQVLLLVDRDAEHDDQRRREKQRDQDEIEAAQRGHAAFSRRPTSSVSPTSPSDISTRNTAIAAANGMLDW